MPKPRKLTIKDAERLIRAENPMAWDAASPKERAEAVALFNAEMAKPDADTFLRKQLAPKPRR